MRFPLLTAAVLLGAAAAVWWALRREKTERTQTYAWVANTALLRQLPAYLRAQKMTRLAAVVAGLALTASLGSLAVLAGAPVDRAVHNQELAQRDLLVCLDASGSMLPYDAQILRQMEEMVGSFAGERLSLQVWSAQTVVKFPLTDDYELAGDVLAEAAQVISRGFIAEQEDYVLVTPELADYLQGIEAPEGERTSSLVGDGLASCVLGFDHRDTERSRTVILATDNEVQGPQIYSLQEAVKFAGDQGVNIIALYPAREGKVTNEGEELRRVVEAAGGSFYQASDPAAIDQIVEEIQSEQLARTEGAVVVTATDTPRTAALWALWSGLLALTALAWRQL